MTMPLTGAPKSWPMPLPPPLPRTVRPVPDEHLSSYIFRLGKANSLNGWHLRDYLKGSKKQSAPVPSELVIALSGQPATAMRYAMLELAGPEQLAVMNVAGRPRPGHTSGTKCAFCMHARGIHHEPVVCWRRAEDVICHRHQRWIGGHEQTDLTGHTEIIQANKRHRRLIRRFGRRPVFLAFNQARDIITRWMERGRYRRYIDEHLMRFHGSRWSLPFDAPTLSAAKYPHVVALTRLLTSPYWRALAQKDHALASLGYVVRHGDLGSSAFGNELRRTVAPTYEWETLQWSLDEPLAQAALRDLDAERKAALIRIGLSVTEHPIDTIES